MRAHFYYKRGGKTNMDINKITLYKHGIGFFDREIEVEDDRVVSLDFDEVQMNDVLKSLTVIDLNGGYITNVSYDNVKPEGSKFTVQLGSALNDLLGQLAGVSITVFIGTETLNGTVIGLQNRSFVSDGNEIDEAILILSDEQGIKQMSVHEIKNIVINDKDVNKELDKYFELALSAKKTEKKKLTIYCKGTGRRKIHVSYMISIPAWKTSYRLILRKEKPLIQAWGLIDNNTVEDWQGVNVSLISGLPISFTCDLYPPYFPQRPFVELTKESAVKPVELEEKIRRTRDSVRLKSVDDECMEDAFDSSDSMKMARFREAYKVSSFKGNAEGKDVGDMFEYHIEKPVTILKDKSASLPLFQECFEGKPLLVYNENVRSRNPMSVLGFKNTTAMTLDGGPLIVIDQDTYVGEAIMPHLKADEKRYIPYSVELGVHVTMKIDPMELPVYMVKIVEGVVYSYFYLLRETEYIIHNKTKKEQTLILEHPRKQGFKLIETQYEDETTENFYRFKKDLKEGFDTLKVVEQKESKQTMYLSKQSTAELEIFLRKEYVSAKLAKEIKDAIKVKQGMEEVNKKNREMETEIQEIVKDQKRIRENMMSLGNSQQETQMRERYLAKLTSQENELEDFIERVKLNKEKIKGLDKEFGEKVKKLNVTIEIKQVSN